MWSTFHHGLDKKKKLAQENDAYWMQVCCKEGEKIHATGHRPDWAKYVALILIRWLKKKKIVIVKRHKKRRR
jgi:hypothetical protein